MSVTPEQEQAQLDALAIAIRQRAEQAFEAMLQRLREGESPRDAIKAVSETFAGEYFSELSTAFSAVLQENVGLATMKAWPVGEVDLSERLYTHLDEVNAVTRGLIADHVKGFVQARTLAMQIYEGYEFKTDPLKVKAKLPKYLREALDDPAVSQGFAQIVGRIRASALKTPALKAAYLQAIDDLEAGVGEGRLRRVTRVAWYERNRYFANRIAQTELHRAYTNQVASELMEDEEAVWVKVQMSRTHPRVDICDYHAGLNAWGQGPGIYPKAKAPKPPFHPHCRCTVRPAYELDAEAKQVERQEAPQAFMQGRSDYDQRLIAGSRDRLQRFRDGESLEEIYNGATKSTYRWTKLGDPIVITQPEQAEPQWVFFDGKTATLDDMKRLGAERLDDLLAIKAPDDRSVIASIIDRGKTIQEIVNDAEARGVTPSSDAMAWFRKEMIAKVKAIRPVGNVRPLLHQKSGKAVSLMNRVAGKLPDEWVAKGNAAGTLDVSVSTKRGFFSERHWNMKAGRLSRFIRTDDSSTVEHEFMHHIQHADANLDWLFEQEHKRRTANDALEVIYSHLPDETGKPDGYVSRYQGREYGGKPLEVITMAFQALIGNDAYANQLFADMLQTDKDMLHLALGTLFHYKP